MKVHKGKNDNTFWAKCFFFTAIPIAVLLQVLPSEQIEYVSNLEDAVLTAYTARAEETDDTPFITASNKRVRQGMVANNCLPFGTQVRIAGMVFTVEDRMNRRYSCAHYDIYMVELDDARNFGRRNYYVEILKSQ